MSPQEFAARLGTREPNLVKGKKTRLPKKARAADAAVDWRKQNAVTPVKDQGSCGSCWAFSATGAIEGAYAKAHGELLSFSEQQLVDCSGGPGEDDNQGCNGGWMDNAFLYAKTTALETEDSYKYTAKDEQCSLHSGKGVATVKAFHDITENDGDQLLEAVSQQPVSVAINAGSLAIQFYGGGVITS